MRFRAPRSCSPSPVRGRGRNATAFGLHSDSESEEYDSEIDSLGSSFSQDDTFSAEDSSSGEEVILVSDLNKMSLRPHHINRSAREEQEVEDTVAAIRRRTLYKDPYEEWEKHARKDASKTARKEVHLTSEKIREAVQNRRLQSEQQTKNELLQNHAAIDKYFDTYRQNFKAAEEMMKAQWKQRDDELWKRVEEAIRLEEAKVAKRLEEERLAREEAERKQKELELKQKLEEQKRAKEAEAKKKAEEEAKRLEEEKAKAEKESQEKRERLAAEKAQRSEQETSLRHQLHLSPVEEDWRVARHNYLQLKTGPVKFVKENKEMKTEWGRVRRQLNAKIGQLTDDVQAISNITSQIVQLVIPPSGPYPESLFITLLYSLAKLILVQAETEVTAEKRSAIPLAQVTFNLLNHPSLGEAVATIFIAQVVKRTGGWALGYVVPNVDIDKRPWADKIEKLKMHGYRKSNSGEGMESTEEQMHRIAALLRVYFHIMKLTPSRPQYYMFRVTRCWTWMARMLSDSRLLDHPIAPHLLYTALDVLGLEARKIWGHQFIKLLALLYEGLTKGHKPGEAIGGKAVAATAGRARATTAIETLMTTPP